MRFLELLVWTRSRLALESETFFRKFGQTRSRLALESQTFFRKFGQNRSGIAFGVVRLVSESLWNRSGIALESLWNRSGIATVTEVGALSTVFSRFITSLALSRADVVHFSRCVSNGMRLRIFGDEYITCYAFILADTWSSLSNSTPIMFLLLVPVGNLWF